MRSMAPVLPSRSRWMRLVGTCILLDTLSTTSWRITERPRSRATCSATSLASEPISWVNAMTVMAFPSIDRLLGEDRVELLRPPDHGEELRDQGPDQQEHSQRRDRSDQRVRPHDRDVALRDEHRLAERVLGLVAEDEREHERRERIVELLEDVADETEAEHEPDVEHRVVHGVGADRADHDDHG